jgi:hypothetical protein
MKTLHVDLIDRDDRHATLHAQFDRSLLVKNKMELSPAAAMKGKLSPVCSIRRRRYWHSAS